MVVIRLKKKMRAHRLQAVVLMRRIGLSNLRRWKVVWVNELVISVSVVVVEASPRAKEQVDKEKAVDKESLHIQIMLMPTHL